MTLFNEGDIVSGVVVRIDKDEVLVDIGYKSEGVIPQNELSIRKNVNTGDEVTLGEEIDALVMQKEDADGRLILSKKRARFEKAWKRIEARSRERRAGHRHGHRGRQGRPHPRPGRARLPARLAGRHPPRAGPLRVRRPGAQLPRHRDEPQPQQRRAVAPRRARRGAQGYPPADHRRAHRGRDRRGHDLQHRRLRRLRRPRRHRRPHPHLRALVDAHQPPVRGAAGQPVGQGQGARHRPRPPAHPPGPQADPGRPLDRRSSPSTTSATSSRAGSPRSSPSAPSSRSTRASRVWSTSPSSPIATSSVPTRSSRSTSASWSRSSRSTPTVVASA